MSRLTTPLLRDGAKGLAAFRPASWDEAIALVAHQRWRAIIAEHGAEAILPYSHAGKMALVQRNAGTPSSTSSEPRVSIARIEIKASWTSWLYA